MAFKRGEGPSIEELFSDEEHPINRGFEIKRPKRHKYDNAPRKIKWALEVIGILNHYYRTGEDLPFPAEPPDPYGARGKESQRRGGLADGERRRRNPGQRRKREQTVEIQAPESAQGADANDGACVLPVSADGGHDEESGGNGA